MKLSEWRLRLKDSVSSALDKISGRADGASSKFAKFQDRLSKFSSQSGGASKGLRGMSSAFSSLGGPLSSVTGGLGNLSNMGQSLGAMISPIGIITAGVTLTAAAMGYGANLALDFDKGMAKINATAQLTRPELDKLRNQLIEVGKDGTAPIESIPDAYEKILSQTGDVNLSMSILKTSLKGAQAGFADINLVASATAQTLSIVGAKNTTANEVMDTLLKAKKVGAGEFSDFATYIPQLIAAGSNLNIAYKDTAGLFAYMTGKGISAMESATLIQNAFTALGKSEITKGLQGSGVQVFDEKGQMLAMDKIFGSLHNKLAGMSSEQKSTYLESIGLMDAQAKSAFAILSGDSEKLSSTMNDVRNSGGELQKQMEATATPTQKWDKFVNRIKGGFIEIGYKIMPYINSFIDWISETTSSIVNGVMDWYNSSELVQDVIGLIGDLFSWVWDVVKKVGASMAWIWNTVMKPIFEKINETYTIIKAVMNGDWNKAGTLLLHQSNDATGNAIENVENATGKQLTIVDGKMIWSTPNADKVAGTDPTATTDASASTLPPKPGDAGASSDGLKSNLKGGSTGVTEGGKSVRNITVNINKLNESINFHGTTVAESATDLENKFIELFLRVTQGAEVALASSGS